MQIIENIFKGEMNMKRIVAVVLCLLIVLSTTACSQGSSNEQKTEVVIWHRWNVGEGESEHELQVAVDKFNDSQNDIIVKLEAQPSAGFNDKVYNSVVNGVGPDIIFDFATVVCDYQDDGFLANIDEYIDVDKLKSRISDELWNEVWNSKDEHIHLIPVHVTVPVLFYNKTMYNKYNLDPPKTWDELYNNCSIIYEKEKVAGFATDSYIDMAQAMFIQNGSGYIDINTSTIGFNTEKSKENVKWFVKGAQSGYFATSYSTGSIDTEFNSGLIASFLGTCAYEPYILPNGFEAAVAPVPSTDENRWIPLFNRGAIVFASDKETESAACKFIEFFTNEENSMRWCTTIGALSPYNDTCERKDYLNYIQDSSVMQVAAKSIPYAGVTPAVNGSVAVRNEIKQLYLKSVGEVDTIDNLFVTAESNCNKALKK